MKTLVIITTYEREDYLTELLDAIGPDPSRYVQVWDDGSQPRYTRVPTWASYRWVPHHGREHYHQLMTRILGKAQHLTHDRVCILPDDVLPAIATPFEEMEDIWLDIRGIDPHAVCLNPLLDRRGHIRQWRGHYPVQVTSRAWMTGWNDLCLYAAAAPFFRAAAIQYEPPREGIVGSGMGSQLTERLRKVGNLYQVDQTLWHHRQGASKMNPEERRKHPL